MYIEPRRVIFTMLSRICRIAVPLIVLASASANGEEHKAAKEEKPAAEHAAAAEHAQAAEPAPAAEREPAAERAPAKTRAALKERSAAEERAGAAAAAASRNPASLIPPPLHPRTAARSSAKPKWVRVAHTAPGDSKAAAEPAIVTPVAMVSMPSATAPGKGEAGHGPHWSYEGSTGPAAWAQLAPEFAACASGTRQSPIDIHEGIKLELDPVVFEYRSSAFQVIDNGHTIQANVSPGNYIRVMGRRFQLVQFHFHRPSEELIDGRPSEMVVHMVHKDADGKLAVVAVLLERGTKQPVIQSVWNNLPLEKYEEVQASTRIDPAQLLPESRKYYAYMGSLTTPPCSEGVLWVVMKQPLQASQELIDLFGRLYPMNARPVQAAAGRLIKESN